MRSSNLFLQTKNVKIENDFLYADYSHELTTVKLDSSSNTYLAESQNHLYSFKTDLRVPKLGLMLVGWGGNNGSTLTASIIANRKGLSWETRRGVQKANYFGSLFLSSTTKIGVDEQGEDVNVPLNKLLPMANPNDLTLGGWDISSLNLAEAMDRAQVLEPDLKRQVYEEMKNLKPLKSIYYKDFIALNQENRADNLIEASSKKDQLETIRNDIKTFKSSNKLDKVIVLWTANTERFSNLIDGVNDTSENVLKAIDQDHSEISASTMFAVASILENCSFINGKH
jgi:myo-inositol-1-phosphate synthase